MRLCTSLFLCLSAAAATVLAPAPVQAARAAGAARAVRADAPPACVGADARAFPLAARIRGGPDSYEAGGGYGTWYIDLTNTTRRTCTGIHPVVVLVDDKRALRPDQPQLDFYDGSRARPVSFRTTDEQELIGVLDGAGFAGFAVPPGRTVSVKVRLALTSDTAPDQVTANAAVVQRRGDDGDWVGESNAYRFGIGPYADGTEPRPEGSRRDGVVEPRPAGSRQGAVSTGTPTSAASASVPDSSLPFAEAAEEAGERARELGGTGLGLVHGLFAATVTLLGVGLGAFLLARRRR
nr:hypothetical protein [Streptomyces broussonetiae]